MSIISIEDIKAHLNVTTDADDALLSGKIAVAESYVDRFLPTPLAELETVPEPLKEAVRQLAGHLYENREASLVGITAEEIPFGFWELISPYREWCF